MPGCSVWPTASARVDHDVQCMRVRLFEPHQEVPSRRGPTEASVLDHLREQATESTAVVVSASATSTVEVGSSMLARALPVAELPRLVLVREPDLGGFEGEYSELAIGCRLVELPEPDRHIAADDDRRPARFDDDDLRAFRVAGCWDEPNTGQQLELAVDRDVLHARCVDPLADVVLLGPCVVELLALDVDRPTGEEVIAAEWSPCRCLLTTMPTLARSKSCVFNGWIRGSISAARGCSSVMPVSTSTRASG